jgi:hypothetical protein
MMNAQPDSLLGVVSLLDDSGHPSLPSSSRSFPPFRSFAPLFIICTVIRCLVLDDMNCILLAFDSTRRRRTTPCGRNGLSASGRALESPRHPRFLRFHYIPTCRRPANSRFAGTYTSLKSCVKVVDSSAFPDSSGTVAVERNAVVSPWPSATIP